MSDDTVIAIRDGIEIPDGVDDPAGQKIIAYTGITRLNIDVGRVLDMARDLDGVVILGYQKDGSPYFASTYADGGMVMWLLRECEHRLLAAASSLTEETT